MLTSNIKVGISTSYIDKLGYEFIRDNKGYSAPLFYRGFKKSLCTSLNHVVCHGIPSDRILEDGDIINIDADKGILDVVLSEKELQKRHAAWAPAENEYGSGALWKYAQTVSSARIGAVTHPGGKKERHTYADI